MFTAKYLEMCRHYVLATVKVGEATKADVVDAADQLLELTDSDLADKDSAWAAIQAIAAELIRLEYVGRKIGRLSSKSKTTKARSVAGVLNSGLSLVVLNHMSPAKPKVNHNHREVWIKKTLQWYDSTGKSVSDLLSAFNFDTGKAADSIAQAPYKEPVAEDAVAYRVLQKEEVSKLDLDNDPTVEVEDEEVIPGKPIETMLVETSPSENPTEAYA